MRQDSPYKWRMTVFWPLGGPNRAIYYRYYVGSGGSEGAEE